MYGLEYSPEIEQSIIQVELQDITKDVISILFPPIPGGANIQFRSSQVFGIMGLGKTSLYRALAVFAYTNYNSNLKNINLISHESLDVLINNIDSKPVQVLFVDDAGLENHAAAKELIGKFTRIRHIFAEKRKAIGKKNGVIVVFFAVQDIYLITKKLRSTVHVDIYKNAPTNDHDKGRLAKKIGLAALKKLDSISNEVFKKHNYEALSECVVSTICGDIGFITYDLILEEDSIITEIESIPEHVNNFKITDGFYQFAEIKEFDGNEMIIQSLYNWESIKKKINLKTKKLKQKHIEAFIKYLQGHTYSKIAEMFNVTDSALTNNYKNNGWMAIVRTEIIGHLVEYQLTQPGEYYAGYKRIAGNARIDLLSPDKNKAIEVKVREQRETPTAKMLSTEMFKLLEQDFHCELCYCIIRYGKAVFKTYHITQTPKQLYDVSTPSPSAKKSPSGKGKGKGSNNKKKKKKVVKETKEQQENQKGKGEVIKEEKDT